MNLEQTRKEMRSDPEDASMTAENRTARKGKTNRSFQFSHLDPGGLMASLASPSVSTSCQHFQVTSETLSGARGQALDKLDLSDGSS